MISLRRRKIEPWARPAPRRAKLPPPANDNRPNRWLVREAVALLVLTGLVIAVLA
jgi:hypothetical protein